MLKIVITALFLSLVSCGGSAPAPNRAGALNYTVVSEQSDPGGLTITIKVPEPITQPGVKAIAEAVIAERKAANRHIVVKSYAEEIKPGDQPVAISTLDGESVTHRFNFRAEAEKIQTH